MMAAFSIHVLAKRELIEAQDYYYKESPQASVGFIEEIEKAFQSLYQFPEAYPVVLGKVRKRVILRFPYNIFYVVRPERIRILAIAHQARRPFYWRSRK